MENLVTQSYLESHYKGKRVFLTGHTGFKGSWMTALLHGAGAIMRGYALEPEYSNSLFTRLQPLDIIDSTIGDIRDKARLKKAILDFKPDYVFHLAAQPLVRRSFLIPAETFDVNVTGTANVLEIVKDLSHKCSVLVITTDKVYENKEQDILYNEEDRLGGYDPYSASKACAELVVSAFRTSFFNTSHLDRHHKAIASARAGNVIGGGDWSMDRIIPDIVRSLMAGTAIQVRNPSAVRPWQHVLEPLTGYLLLASRLDDQPADFSRPYNFGPKPEDHLPVRSVVQLAIRTWGEGSWEHVGLTDQPHEAGLLKLDITRVIKELNWRPKLTATEAIEWTMEWYRQPDVVQVDFTFQQVDKYLQL